MLFPNERRTPNQEWLSSCQELFALSEEIIRVMGRQLLPVAAYHSDQTPSMFALAA